MDNEQMADEWGGTGDEPARRAAWPEKIVPPLVVTAISVAGVLASLMQPRSPEPVAAPAAMRASAGMVQAPPGSPRVPGQRAGRV